MSKMKPNIRKLGQYSEDFGIGMADSWKLESAFSVGNYNYFLILKNIWCNTHA